MKTDLVKLLMFLWLCATAYGIYEIWANISYIADLMDAYMRAVLGQIRK